MLQKGVYLYEYMNSLNEKWLSAITQILYQRHNGEHHIFRLQVSKKSLERF